MRYFKYKASKVPFIIFAFCLVVLCTYFSKSTNIKAFTSLTLGTYYVRALDFIADANSFINFQNKLPIFQVSMNPNNFNYLELERLKMVDFYEKYNAAYIEKRNYYNAKISFNGEKVSSKVKLFGMMPDHFRDHIGHSFRVKYNGQENFGRKTVNLAKPRSLDYNNDVFLNILYKDHFNGLKIQFEPVRVLFNKIDYGTYLKYDFFDKYLLEENGYRDSFIFENKLDSISFNHIPELTSDKYINDFSKTLLDDFISFIDYEKYIFMLSISMILNDNEPHILGQNNLHWIYNSVTNKIEPTIRESFLYIEGRIYNVLKKNTIENIFNQINFDDVSRDFINFHGKAKVLNSIKYKLLEIEGVWQQVRHSEEYNSFSSKMVGFSNQINLRDEVLKRNLKYLLKCSENINSQKKIETNLRPIKISNDTIIDKDFIINNQSLFIKDGVTVTFINNADLIVNYGSIKSSGNLNSRVYFKVNNSISSIYIFKTNNVEFNYTTFNGFSALNKDIWSLPSAITLYESNAIFSNSIFENNLSGDDMINIYKCDEVKFVNCFFESIISDAIDSDFSKIKIYSSKFKNIGNDAIDGSGSIVSVSNSYFDNISDKAISAGEKSEFYSINNKIENSELGIVVKDGSVLNSKFDTVLDTKVDLVLFRKKPFYKLPSAFLDKSFFNDSLISRGIFINNNLIKNYVEADIEELLYGNIYGKATIKN